MVGKPITIIDQKIMKARTRDFDNSEHKKSRREMRKENGNYYNKVFLKEHTCRFENLSVCLC